MNPFEERKFNNLSEGLYRLRKAHTIRFMYGGPLTVFVALRKRTENNEKVAKETVSHAHYCLS